MDAAANEAWRGIPHDAAWLAARLARESGRPPRGTLLDRDRWVATALRLLGLEAEGRRGLADLRLERHEVVVPGLGPAFDGFRVLQVTDLHADLDPPVVDRVLALLRRPDAAHDLAVLTGDFRQHHGAADATVHALLGPLLDALRAAAPPQPLAVLGNHDPAAIVPLLAAHGVRVLLNDAVVLRRGGDALAVAGIDDPAWFGLHDLARARAACGDAPSILLAHAPRVAPEAARLGFALQLSGHTHGGQFRTRGGFPLFRHRGTRRRWIAGAWAEGTMRGYTCRGAGAAGVAARIHCPAEVTLHVLRRGRAAS